jgi:hypothetical protein
MSSISNLELNKLDGGAAGTRHASVRLAMTRILERNRVSVLSMNMCGVWKRLHSASVRYHALATIQVAWSRMYNGLDLVRPLLSKNLLSYVLLFSLFMTAFTKRH